MWIRSRTWQRFLSYSAIVAASVLIALGAGTLNVIHSLDLRALDAQFVLRGKKKTRDIVLVVADQKTYDNISDVQLFWHPYYAEAIRAAADGGAAVMALDIAFTIPVGKWEPDHDRILADAVAEVSSRIPVICGYVPAAMTKQQQWPIPVNMIASALGLAAFVNFTADPDSFVRRQELLEANTADASAPLARALSLRVAEKYLKKDADFDGHNMFLGGRRVPIGPARTLHINFAGPASTFPSVSLWDFLQAARAGNKQQLREWVGNKIVLLGVDNITDRFPTPFYTAFSGRRWTTAGVEIHANTIQTLLSGDFIVPAPAWGHVLSVVLVTLGTVTATALMGSVAAGIWVTSLVAAILIGVHILFRFGIIISVSELMVASVLAMLLTGVERLFRAQKRTELFGRALSVFVGRNVASVLDQSGDISLTGKHQFVTILFSDIRGFTAFCEQKDPAVVVEVLNQYLAEMVRVITHHKGTVNKFIGDGILAVFSDDDGAVHGDHALRAVNCGIAMCQVKTDFQTGVGIHTGVVVIGNIGTSDRVEYAVLGDTVNVASRIEGLNKIRNTQLLMSESTKSIVDGHVETVFLGETPVRGQTRSLNIYTAATLVRTSSSMAAQKA